MGKNFFEVIRDSLQTGIEHSPLEGKNIIFNCHQQLTIGSTRNRMDYFNRSLLSFMPAQFPPLHYPQIKVKNLCYRPRAIVMIPIPIQVLQEIASDARTHIGQSGVQTSFLQMSSKRLACFFSCVHFYYILGGFK